MAQDEKPGKTGVDKWNQSVARARGKEDASDAKTAALVKQEDDAKAIANSDDADKMPSALLLIEEMTPEKMTDLIARMRAGQIEISEQYVSLKPGQSITGQILRQGVTQLPDLQAKEGEAPKMVDVPTWHFRNNETGIQFSMIGAYMLNRNLPMFLGRKVDVTIYRGPGFIETRKGRRLARFLCYAEREIEQEIDEVKKGAIDVQSTEVKPGPASAG